MANVIEQFETQEVKHFIEAHINDNAKELALKFRGKVSFDINIVSSQIELWQHAKKKLPTWCAANALFTKLMYEQCTSEKVAQYKSTLFSGKKLLDATAGSGVDAFFIGKNFKDVTMLETDYSKVKFLEYNFKKLKPPFKYNIKNTDAESWLHSNNDYDLIYIDPDRRDENKNRNILFELCSPDLMKIVDILNFSIASVAVKLSPLLDLQYIIKKLQPTQIICIAEHNEMKEILVVINKSKRGEETSISAVNIEKESNTTYIHTALKIKRNNTSEKYFYECGNAIIKANLCDSYFNHLDIEPQNMNATFGTANHFNSGFIGRKFLILEQSTFSQKLLSLAIAKYKIEKCNITCRDFVLTPVEILKKNKLKDGGDLYLFFTRNKKGEKIFFVTTTVRNL